MQKLLILLVLDNVHTLLEELQFESADLGICSDLGARLHGQNKQQNTRLQFLHHDSRFGYP